MKIKDVFRFDRNGKDRDDRHNGWGWGSGWGWGNGWGWGCGGWGNGCGWGGWWGGWGCK